MIKSAGTPVDPRDSTPVIRFPTANDTFSMLLAGAAIRPDALAFRYLFDGKLFTDSVDYTFAQLAAKLYQTANLFSELGLKPTDVISCLLPNIPEMAFTLWGGQAVGIVNPINPLLEAGQIAAIMRSAGTKVLVCLAPFPKTDIWQKVEKIKDKIPTLQTIVTVDLRPYLPIGKQMAVLAWQLVNPKAQSHTHQIIDFNEWLRRQPDDHRVQSRFIQPEEIACYFHTGGTTGTPKLAPLTHSNLTSMTRTASLLLGPGASQRPETFFCGLPWFHVNGVVITGSIPWSLGYTLVMGSLQGYRGPGIVKNFWKIVELYQITAFSGVPTVYSYLLDVPVENQDISSLQYAFCGAAPLSVDVIRAFEQRTGVQIAEGYGLTEGTCISTCNPLNGKRIAGSIGLPLPEQEIKPVILDEQTGSYIRDAQPNEIGVLVVRGPNVFGGYQQPQHNRGIWVDTGDGGEPYYNTGDLGRIDEEGYFYITGRKKELIIRGGHNIDPRLIEEVLTAHPAVALAAAIGRPDAMLGEVPVAYVTLSAGKQASEEELLHFVNEYIPERAAIPKRIYIESNLPLTAIGKLFKPALIKQEISRVYREEVTKIEGIRLLEIAVHDDPKAGFSVHLEGHSPDTLATEQRLKTALTGFTFPYRITWR
ncbi:fatty-acyl-CoA synthase [Fibrisoma limi BUZ 3]|uniref:Fatty-acyl-CoA synthase n=1 Tax=Fibrisoma limi BUZ 3 TaxID=1185876 RepID=I2GK27_9BACT|nr:acyl-CoA synthetase [Fibrisoma limi]CCH54252.1 fatty-acyl-CoA synthase [Fibrisoma limi BUZ 3]